MYSGSSQFLPLFVRFVDACCPAGACQVSGTILLSNSANLSTSRAQTATKFHPLPANSEAANNVQSLDTITNVPSTAVSSNAPLARLKRLADGLIAPEDHGSWFRVTAVTSLSLLLKSVIRHAGSHWQLLQATFIKATDICPRYEQRKLHKLRCQRL